MVNSGGRVNVLYRTVSSVLLAFTAIMIFYLSHQTGSESADLSGGLLSLLRNFIGQDAFRTIAHFGEYAVLGFFAVLTLHSFYNYIRPIFAVVAGTVYAASDEIHQFFVPGRALQLTDWLVDVSGTAVGVAVCTVIILIIARRK